MRRMYSDGQVVKVVNKAIEEGEIQAGGLTPEQEEKIDNALQLPESAPAAQQLVGINTSGEQNALTVGEGLSINNGELKATGEKILTLDFNNKTSLQLTEEIATNINNLVYDKVIIENYYASTSSNTPNKLICVKNYVSELAYNGDYDIATINVGTKYLVHSQKPIYCNYSNSNSSSYIYGGYINCKLRIRDLGLSINNSHVATLKNLENEVDPLQLVMNKITLATGETTKSGTVSINYIDNIGFTNINTGIEHTVRWRDLRFIVADTDLNISVPLYFKELMHAATVAEAKIYFTGEAIDTATGAPTARYILSLDSHKAYTLTKVSL